MPRRSATLEEINKRFYQRRAIEYNEKAYNERARKIMAGEKIFDPAELLSNLKEFMENRYLQPDTSRDCDWNINSEYLLIR